MLDIFSLGKIVFVVGAIAWVVRDYKAKNFSAIPSNLLIVYFLALTLIYEFVPNGIRLPFVYSALVIGIGACIVAANFYRVRKDKFRYWFNLILAILIAGALILGVLGIIG